jgi:ABC-type dipeptide/oligopeptide/nickel transport system ATPase component
MQFRTQGGIVHVVNSISFDLEDGETFNMAGKSGCGRNVVMLSVLSLIPDSPGKVTVGKALF